MRGSEAAAGTPCTTPRGARCVALMAVLLAVVPVAMPVRASDRVPAAAPAGTTSAVQQVTTGDGVVLQVRTAHDSPDERQTVDQLRRILSRHALAPWIGTRELLVDSDAIPHSDPVLTLDTSYLDDDTGQLASFVHEQFHWYLGESPARLQALDQVLEEFSRMFPDAPVKGPEGARGLHSTLLHLVVCNLELHAMEVLVGREQARRELAGKHFYRWIYRQVLENPQIDRVMREHGLTLPANPRAADAIR